MIFFTLSQIHFNF